MNPENPMEFLPLLKELGIPTGFVLGILFVLWRTVKLVGSGFKKWVMPLVENVVSKHIALVNSFETSLTKITTTTEKNTELQLAHTEMLKSHLVMVERQSELLNKQSQLLHDLNTSFEQHHKFAIQIAQQISETKQIS